VVRKKKSSGGGKLSCAVWFYIILEYHEYKAWQVMPAAKQEG
jgi:hypothetical protein